MADILSERVCPFCPEHLLRFHEERIVLDGVHWVITPNHTPYANTTVHMLVILKRHVSVFGELTGGELKELQELTEIVRKERGLEGLSVLMRYGKMSLTGASVDHLHCHLVASTGDPEKKVKVRIG
jgi:diadenosine tetraphosphate (Ap4A) HIT family hydrolase